MARLRYLCRLIARDRQGFCPINGILIVLPASAAEADRRADELAFACKTDLMEAFRVFSMRCPVLALVSDLQTLDGFSTLLERLPSADAAKRMGQRFPLAPELENGKVPGQIEASVSWIGNTMFPSMVYTLFKTESPGGEDAAQLLSANTQLYRFLAAMRERHARIARLVRDSLPGLPDEPILYGGCYFAGTGSDSRSEQAFTSGVLMRLIQEQDRVAWTAHSVSEDKAYMRLARILKVALLTVITIAIIYIVGQLIARWYYSRPTDDQPQEEVTHASGSISRRLT
jgi:type VI secretion system protein ImpL